MDVSQEAIMRGLQRRAVYRALNKYVAIRLRSERGALSERSLVWMIDADRAISMLKPNERTVMLVFTEAKLEKRAHPHMFRDTFAVEMLLAGVPLDQVSLLLGHSSTKVTEKHYSPFVKARQQQLKQSVMMAWK